MTRITYEIVEHDGGWAYKVGDVFSEPFPSHDAARRAAERAAHEQVLPGKSTDISYEDKDGRWHEERSVGSDRPETDIEGSRGLRPPLRPVGENLLPLITDRRANQTGTRPRRSAMPSARPRCLAASG